MIHRIQAQKQCKEGEVVRGKSADITAASAGIILDIFAECDEAGKGRNERAHAADIDAEKQVCVISRKLREQNR